VELFESSFRRHLAVEQRRAVLEALAERLGPDVVMGDVLDAAEELGWGEGMGDLTLADLAAALLEPQGAAQAPAAVVEQPQPEPEPAPAPKAKKQARTTAAQKPEPAPAKTTAKAKKAAKATARSKTSRLRALRAKIDADDRMSLEEAAELLVPVIEELGQATMQDLEEFTGIGRRKLRFHIGQLVRHDHLARHGMGRGTYYTTVE
jgi:division protein CdvB (Snf7/Vps24/ESCRT-III family)